MECEYIVDSFMVIYIKTRFIIFAKKRRFKRKNFHRIGCKYGFT